MRTVIVLMLLTATFALGAAASIEDAAADDHCAFDAVCDPVLTEPMLRELADSAEVLLGVTIDAAQREDLNVVIRRAWRVRDVATMTAVVARVEAWRQAREQSPEEIARWAQRERPNLVERLSENPGAVEQWMLDVLAATGSEPPRASP